MVNLIDIDNLGKLVIFLYITLYQHISMSMRFNLHSMSVWTSPSPASLDLRDSLAFEEGKQRLGDRFRQSPDPREAGVGAALHPVMIHHIGLLLSG